MTIHKTLAALSAFALLGCGARSAQTVPEAPVSSSGDDASAFTFEQAIAAARQSDPSAVPIEVELEEMDGSEFIEVELIRGDQIAELYYDPTTGELVREGIEELDPNEAAALPALTARLHDGDEQLESALQIARRHYTQAELREVELEMHGDTLIIEVEVDHNGKRAELIHDVSTGALIGDESEDDHAEQ